MGLIAKICLLGDGKVGKTSLVNRYLGKGFTSDYLPTLGSEFASKEIQLKTVHGPKDIKFQIWDLAGQPSFDQIRRVYYKGSIGAILVFDLTRFKSLKNLEHWVKEFNDNSDVPNHTLIVLANKSDLKSQIKVTSKEIEDYIQTTLQDNNETGFQSIKFLKTSAKTGENVEEAFEYLGYSIVKKLYG